MIMEEENELSSVTLNTDSSAQETEDGLASEEITCHCCGVETSKARLHYGGITCYPCRSFFRRATVSKRKKKCKKDGRCGVKLDDRKSCNACRYSECLRNGMRPQLVLSEDQIQERFKNLDKERKKRKTQKSRIAVPDLPRQSIIRCNEGSTSDQLISSAQVIDSRREANLIVYNRGLERPSIFKRNTQFRLSDGHNHLLAPKQTFIKDESSQLSCHRQAHVGQKKSVIMLANRQTRGAEYSVQYDDKEENMGEDAQCEKESETRIRNLHLKLSRQQRSYVEYSFKNEFEVENEVDAMLLKTLNTIDIKEIENMYTIEERSYVQFMGQKFRDKWCEVNIGPDVMREYISWCRKEGPLSQEMFQVVSRATSERFTRMVETTDEFQHLNIHDKFSLLKNNLKFASTVTMIRKLSFLNPQEDFFDSWGNEDRKMWHESGMNLHSQSMSNILKEMPFDVLLKQQFISLLSQCKLPILADQHVFSLMVTIVIFSTGDIQLIER